MSDKNLVSIGPVTAEFTRLVCVLNLQNCAVVHMLYPYVTLRANVAGRDRAGLCHAFLVCCAAKQVAMGECCLLRRLMTVRSSPTAEERSDTNGPLVSNGHPTVSGGQANECRLIGNTDRHLVAHANGHSVGRNHAPLTDSPAFSPTLDGSNERNNLSLAHENNKQNAEVHNNASL